MSIDVSHLKYNPKPLRLKFALRLENWWRGARDSRNVFKGFCQELDIDYPPKPGKKYSLPDQYDINTEWIQYLGKLRDEFIANQSTAYHAANKRVRIKMDEIKGIIAQDEQYLAELQATETTLRNKLKSERAKKNKNSLEIISLESEVEKKKAKISNCKTDIEGVRADLTILEDVLAGNHKSWRKQTEIADTVVRQAAKKYVVYVTKYITKYLNYTNFGCSLPRLDAILEQTQEEI